MRIALTKENERALEDNLKEMANSRLRDAKRRYQNTIDYIESYTRELAGYYRAKQEASDIIIQEENKTLKVAQKLLSVLALDKVKEAFYETEGKNICVKTNDLYFRTLNGGRYFLGEADITYNTTNMSINFNSNNKRRSYWGNNCPHPHVSTNGNACLGNTAELIASLQADGEYGLIFEVLIAFLEQANTDDCAGRHAMNWDKVDEEGNVIQEGFMNYDGKRFHYGATPEEDTVGSIRTCECCCNAIDDEDDDYYTTPDGNYVCQNCYDEYYYTCEDCGEVHHSDNMTYVYDHGHVCQACLDDNYRYCNECEEWVHIDNIEYVEIVGDYVCVHCLTNSDKYAYCSDCEEWFPSDETTYVESANKDVCHNCLERYYDKCAKCGAYFLVEDMVDVDDEVLCKACHEERQDDEEALHELHNQDIVDTEEELPQYPEFVEPDATCCVCGKVVTPETSVVCGTNTYCVPCAVTNI